MDKKDYANGYLDDKFCSDKSCAAINVCSRDGIYSLLIILLSICILILIYFIANFLL